MSQFLRVFLPTLTTFGTKVYRHIVVIHMSTNGAPLIADLFLFCYERDFIASLSHNKEAGIIQLFNSKSRCLDDLSNIDNLYFIGIAGRIYLSKLQLHKANASHSEAPLLDLHLSISSGFVSS